MSAWPVERPSDWVAFVNEAQGEEELAAIRASVARGRPFGSDEWREEVVAEMGLGWTMRPRGRPREGAGEEMEG